MEATQSSSGCPATTWLQVAGHRCPCGNPATHIYMGVKICCQCHGGDWVTVAEAEQMHEQAIRDGKRMLKTTAKNRNRTGYHQ